MTAAFNLRLSRTGLGVRQAYTKVYSPALVAAMNRTAEEVQVHGRQRLYQRLTVRSARSGRFLESLIKINADDRATPQRPRARVGIQAGSRVSDTAKARFLLLLETGGVRRSSRGEPIAIPTRTLRPTASAVIPGRLYPRNLGLLSKRDIAGGFTTPGRARPGRREGTFRVSLRGARRTYAIDPRYHRTAPPYAFGIWQRRGRGRNSEVFLLWNYRMSVPVPRKLSFAADSKTLVAQRFPVNIAGFTAAFARRSAVGAR